MSGRRLALLLAGGLAVTLSAPAAHAEIAVRSFASGPVLTAGLNSSGQLGTGTTTDSTLFVAPVGSPKSATSVATNGTTSAAVRSDGTVIVWGANPSGLILPSAGATILSPTVVPGLSGMRSVAVGGASLYAVSTAGQVWSWGTNDQGQLGLGDTAARSVPTQVSGLSGIVRVVSSGGTVLAVTGGGTMYGWGDNSTRAAVPSSATVAVTRPTTIGSSIVGITTGGGASFTTTTSGTVRGWGLNTCRRLGTDPATTVVTSPRTLDFGTRFVNDVSAGATSAVAIMHGGGIRTWGCNTKGELGRTTTASVAAEGDAKARTVAGPNIVEVSVAGQSVLVRDRYKGFWVWGDNAHGQLGLTGPGMVTVPTEVTFGVVGMGVQTVAAGGVASVIVRERT